MEIYVITLLVLFLFSVIELRVDLTEVQLKIMAILVYFLFVFQVGFRWQTGTDWEPYLSHFNEIVHFSDINNTITGFEKGYSLFVLLIKLLSTNYTVFLVLHALLFYNLIFQSFSRLSPYLFIALLVFYANSIGVWGANRQLIALGICLYSLRYITERNTLKFFLLIALAFSFHSSSILFIVFYFFNRDIKQSVLIGILIVSFIIGKTNIPYAIFSFTGQLLGGAIESKTLAYSGNFRDVAIKNQLSIIGLIRRLVYLVLFMLNYKFLATRLPYYKVLFNGFCFGLVIYFLFSSSLTIMVNRGSLYFVYLEGLLLSCQFLVFRYRIEMSYLLVLLFIVSIFFLFQSISGYEDLFVPYKGTFINTQFHRFRLQ